MPHPLVCAIRLRPSCGRTGHNRIRHGHHQRGNQYRPFTIRAHDSNDIGAAIERALGNVSKMHRDFVGLNAIAFPTEVLHAWLSNHAEIGRALSVRGKVHCKVFGGPCNACDQALRKLAPAEVIGLDGSKLVPQVLPDARVDASIAEYDEGST